MFPRPYTPITYNHDYLRQMPSSKPSWFLLQIFYSHCCYVRWCFSALNVLDWVTERFSYLVIDASMSDLAPRIYVFGMGRLTCFWLLQVKGLVQIAEDYFDRSCFCDFQTNVSNLILDSFDRRRFLGFHASALDVVVWKLFSSCSGGYSIYEFSLSDLVSCSCFYPY